jgi:hypothetical protein
MNRFTNVFCQLTKVLIVLDFFNTLDLRNFAFQS